MESHRLKRLEPQKRKPRPAFKPTAASMYLDHLAMCNKCNANGFKFCDEANELSSLMREELRQRFKKI